MTEDFHLRFEWLDGSGVRDDALRATFARLEINVGDLRVTRAFDRRVQTVVEGIHVALLPLATWAVDAWWTAVAELPRSVRVRSVREVDTSEERRWHRRHGWLSSREGFAVPEVVFSRGEGDATRLSWFNEPETDDTMPLLFLAHGTELVPRDVVQAELARLIDGVLARCEGIGSPVVEALRERWAMIGSAAETERRVCERSARMGLDAYDDREVEDALAALLGRSDIAVGDPLVDDLLDVADAGETTRLGPQIERFCSLTGAVPTLGTTASQPDFTRARARVRDEGGLPFERGYARARVVRRDILKLSDDVVAEPLDRALEELLPNAAVSERADAFLMHGVHALAATAGGLPFVFTRPRRPAGKRFDRARALHVLLASEQPRLVTASLEPDQQASRAFAAELLAPERYLRPRLKSRFADSEDIEDLAAELAVDPRLVRHQIKNHHLAEIVDD